MPSATSARDDVKTAGISFSSALVVQWAGIPWSKLK